MRPMKERVNLTLDGDLLEDLRTCAENDDRSLSQYLNHILKTYMYMTEPDSQKEKI